ncbi:hypothetical protein N7528_009258 [Penicillium herquei]|nr:hypothetical protein N7528_009258 [Penicillium herquei]
MYVRDSPAYRQIRGERTEAKLSAPSDGQVEADSRRLLVSVVDDLDGRSYENVVSRDDRTAGADNRNRTSGGLLMGEKCKASDIGEFFKEWQAISNAGNQREAGSVGTRDTVQIGEAKGKVAVEKKGVRKGGKENNGKPTRLDDESRARSEKL